MGNMRTLALIVIKSYKQGESFQNKNKKQKKPTTKQKKNQIREELFAKSTRGLPFDSYSGHRHVKHKSV